MTILRTPLPPNPRNQRFLFGPFAFFPVFPVSQW